MNRLVKAVLGSTLVAAVAVAGATASIRGGGENIVEVAQGNKDFSTLVDLVVAADLADALSDADAALTVFAPTNKAFENLEKAVPGVTDALLDPKNKSLLQRVLRYHVLGAEVKSGAAVTAAKAKAKVATLLGKGPNAKLALSLRNGKIRIADSAGIANATVTAADVDASNGVIHVINQVLIPKGVAKALTDAGLLK